ncbi:hypothetical protein [Tychonema sp. BBK16]|uniref:hypothetical protein n=1 Tax=Tychonema sp. BBK16 TaxID=2699888 RepID=UPI001F434085|nr:hypothetical protein [Tychonema sp. BBK16]MCF6375873.1 hypothetical protein [Tychonema sp. BBK16]
MMETKNKPLPAREMHKIVWGGVGVLTLFFVTYPIAMWRVSQMEKFRGSHVKSFTLEGKKPDSAVASKPAEPAIASSPTSAAVAVDSTKKLPEKSPEVAPVANNSPEVAIASSPTDKTVQALPVSAGKQEVQVAEGTNQTAEITDRTKLDELALKVYDRINQTWQATPTFTQNLVYRVTASQDGAIANFEPLNQPAKDYTQETPLPNLLKSSKTTSSNSAAPVAKLTVVFAPAGILEVNP